VTPIDRFPEIAHTDSKFTIMRRRARQFNPEMKDFRRAIHWLWQRGVPRQLIAELFGKSENLVSVLAHNENLNKQQGERRIILPTEPDLGVAGDDALLNTAGTSTLELAEEVARAEEDFWSSVRSLAGIPRYGELLQRLSERSEEDILALRLRARLKKMTAETYAHAGYAKSAIALAAEALEIDLKLYDETWSKDDLASYAKICLLMSLAHTHREEWKSALAVIDRAERAFSAADIPVDPELYRQRAFILLEQGKNEEAEKLFKKAFQVFPAHREFLGFGQENYAQHDVGIRPLAVLSGDFEGALENLDIARAWPAGDIHHAINLNWAIATALLSDSLEAKRFAEEHIARAMQESRGFGHQASIIFLLAMTPRIPQEHRRDWIKFALNYNAYRNR
jgi:tetratricopeptide (TPR) repeat protein